MAATLRESLLRTLILAWRSSASRAEADADEASMVEDALRLTGSGVATSDLHFELREFEREGLAVKVVSVSPRGASYRLTDAGVAMAGRRWPSEGGAS